MSIIILLSLVITFSRSRCKVPVKTYEREVYVTSLGAKFFDTGQMYESVFSSGLEHLPGSMEVWCVWLGRVVGKHSDTTDHSYLWITVDHSVLYHPLVGNRDVNRTEDIGPDSVRIPGSPCWDLLHSHAGRDAKDGSRFLCEARVVASRLMTLSRHCVLECSSTK